MVIIGHLGESNYCCRYTLTFTLKADNFNVYSSINAINHAFNRIMLGMESTNWLLCSYIFYIELLDITFLNENDLFKHEN